MGIAAYNRGTSAISAHIDAGKRPVEFDIMDVLNSLEKYPDAGMLLGNIHFPQHQGGFIAECPVTGFGFWYPTLHEAVKRWKVRIVGCNKGVFMGVPA